MKEILSYMTTWMNYEGIMLSFISQSQKLEISHEFYLNEVSKVPNSQKQKIKWLFPGTEEKDKWGVSVQLV